MNQPLLLHVVERLESFASKLPATIQKPILSELTPLKELFLQQRAPRFLFSGSGKMPIAQILATIFPPVTSQRTEDRTTEIYRWQDVHFSDRGTMSIIDARGAGDSARNQVQEELKRQPADIIFFVDEGDAARGHRKAEIENLSNCLDWNDSTGIKAKLIGITISSLKRSSSRDHKRNDDASDESGARLQTALESKPAIGSRLVQVFSFSPNQSSAHDFLSILARELPNEARIEMIRISGDREAQHQVAQVLVKSTAAICTAIGAQPIPLADMPILTTLQLVMVSGIMYVSGRERSLRAATEFVGALGANVGVGMLLREGTRALLKFFPGWGNVLCGMVAGAGTYAIGRAAVVFFLEGASLKDARRAYITSRRPKRPALLGRRRQQKESARAK
ncbi:MAG: hypothetical protein M3R29_03025 [Verrucomicrobiota bacterium]|nr:hypothetical protein [Verrucomicrobiota bacterium]